MKAFPSDFLLEKFGGREEIESCVNAARVWSAKLVLRQIADDDEAKLDLPEPELSRFRRALQLTELRALDLMPEWRKDTRSDEGVEFRDFCSFAFDLRRILPQPVDTATKVKSDTLLVCAAVLGDRATDVRRHFSDQVWSIVESSLSDFNWGQRLFYTTTYALFRLVRKKGWKDLEDVAQAISCLREQQKDFESDYLNEENSLHQTAALELVSFYHFAKAIEVLGLFIGTGNPATAIDEVEFHVTRAIRAADAAGILELALLFRWTGAAARSLARATIWHQLAAYNDKVTSFKRSLASRSNANPMFDLLPPQRDAIQELMSIGNRAIVVQLPTSGGKTLLAEFRIIQTKVNVAQSWIAYLVPTRALVNQITARLRRDLGPLDFKVELASPAIEVDVFEDEVLNIEGSFDVLVTTPEKLDLLIRSKRIDLESRTLGLVVLDEAHNIGDGERGLRSELLLATINRESPDTHFLLLTPFVDNADELAKWIDDERSKSIKPSLSVNWQPNDRVIGLAYLNGSGRNWGINLRPLHTSQPSTHFPEEVELESCRERDATISQAKSSKKKVSAELARVLSKRDCSIVLAYSPHDSWDIARDIAGELPEIENLSANIELVKRFVKVEYGDDFVLSELLSHGVGVHHGGLSPDTRYLLEWLVEKNELKALVATSTIAQGVNFPISSVVLATHHKPVKIGNHLRKVQLRPDEFWNVAGRAGRLFQDSLGLVLFASVTTEDDVVEKYVDLNLVQLASALEEMIADTMDKGWDLDLRRLVRNDAKWSSFVQFLSHTYRQINDHSRFLADTEMLLKRTYAYRRLADHKPQVADQLLQSTRVYAEQLKNLQPGIASLVDTTGFSPETVMDLLMKKQDIQLDTSEWSPSKLFSIGSEGLDRLVGHMLGIQELNIDPRGKGDPTIAKIISMWVGGKSLREIADHEFPISDDSSKRITDCCRLIFQKLSQNASWGLSALQSMTDINLDSLTADQKETYRTLPAMIYYGCNTMEGVLMRSLNVPRSISVPLGKAFNDSLSDDHRASSRIVRARQWLETDDDKKWDKAAFNVNLSGRDARNIWRVLNGYDPLL